MNTGRHSSEFWLAVHWSLMAGGAVASLLHLLSGDWKMTIATCLPVCVLVYMAGVVTNNYGENRFQLKARDQALPQQPDSDPGKTFVFGPQIQHQEPNEEEDEE